MPSRRSTQSAPSFAPSSAISQHVFVKFYIVQRNLPLVRVVERQLRDVQPLKLSPALASLSLLLLLLSLFLFVAVAFVFFVPEGRRASFKSSTARSESSSSSSSSSSLQSGVPLHRNRMNFEIFLIRSATRREMCVRVTTSCSFRFSGKSLVRPITVEPPFLVFRALFPLVLS